jgi:hypothetical protein
MRVGQDVDGEDMQSVSSFFSMCSWHSTRVSNIRKIQEIMMQLIIDIELKDKLNLHY